GRPMLLDPRRNHHAAREAKAWALFPYLASFVWCECSARKERERRGPGRSKQMDESVGTSPCGLVWQPTAWSNQLAGSQPELRWWSWFTCSPHHQSFWLTQGKTLLARSRGFTGRC